MACLRQTVNLTSQHISSFALHNDDSFAPGCCTLDPSVSIFNDTKDISVLTVGLGRMLCDVSTCNCREVPRPAKELLLAGEEAMLNGRALPTGRMSFPTSLLDAVAANRAGSKL